ncbi:MAG: hypothetical protein SD837_21975 [Candidatus Electrothrix scaldis]|nr:MAG: hypothetical protein SD837_21975 [Candidatus Electrothrix sp. GW3-3]
MSKTSGQQLVSFLDDIITKPNTLTTLYICELAHSCDIPCPHSKPHSPILEQDGLCHKFPAMCGDDNETPCLCVPFQTIGQNRTLTQGTSQEQENSSVFSSCGPDEVCCFAPDFCPECQAVIFDFAGV